ncbi:hypothetical protein EVAR_75629_1 [Eumeta japonica]|uniref:Uncharacterized protein n=1 Tax=Eumeta variegata TaxID=151549 RepID=A0A4C1U093_EUMVA|nr:hypothetical protein EVAR_75629_1 [Eumeta japonica]
MCLFWYAHFPSTQEGKQIPAGKFKHPASRPRAVTPGRTPLRKHGPAFPAKAALYAFACSTSLAHERDNSKISAALREREMERCSQRDATSERIFRLMRKCTQSFHVYALLRTQQCSDKVLRNRR